MVTNKKLFKYIKLQLKQGFTKEQIYLELSVVGWNAEDLEATFNMASASVSGLPTPFDKGINISGMIVRVKILWQRHTILISGIILLILVIITGYVFRDYVPMIDIIPSSFTMKNCSGQSNLPSSKYYKKSGKYYLSEMLGQREIQKGEYMQAYETNKMIMCN